ncbi:MAG: ABC transporter ATP-binding protein [Anaerolineae bacterium]
MTSSIPPSGEGRTSDPGSIVLDQVRFAYPALAPELPPTWVLDALDLTIRPGEWLAVLAGLAPQLTGGTLEGRIVVAGQDSRQYVPPALAGTVGIVFQEPEAQLFNPTVEAEVAWGLENLAWPVDAIRARVNTMLALFRLEHLRYRAPTDLSGGEKKRLTLASVLAMKPPILILDEPMGGLDPAGRQEVLTALSDLRKVQSATIVMTESDPEAVAAFAERLVILQRGQIALDGTPRALFAQIERLAALGVSVPQMALVAATLNRHLGTTFDFLDVEEARNALAVHLG